MINEINIEITLKNGKKYEKFFEGCLQFKSIKEQLKTFDFGENVIFVLTDYGRAGIKIDVLDKKEKESAKKHVEEYNSPANGIISEMFTNWQDTLNAAIELATTED